MTDRRSTTEADFWMRLYFTEKRKSRPDLFYSYVFHLGVVLKDFPPTLHLLFADDTKPYLLFGFGVLISSCVPCLVAADHSLLILSKSSLEHYIDAGDVEKLKQAIANIPRIALA